MIKKSALALTVAAIILSGCSHKDPKIYATDGPVADGDMLVESTIGDAKNLNPPLIDEVGGADIADLVFNGLLRFNEKMEPLPCLAERWTVSKDGKTITYYLRKGVKFHDGVEFTADDVVFTYKVYSDPTVNTPAGSNYQDIKSVEIMDPYIVKVVYKRPYAPALSGTFDNILPKHLLEGQDINNCDFNRHPVGTGPYKFVEWKTAQKIVLEANPDYWEGAPHIKKFVMRIITDQTTEFLELLNGGIDAMGAWTHSTMTAEQYVRQTDTPKYKDYYNSFPAQDLAYSYIGWNELNPLFQDKKVRQALTMSIDRDTILKNVSYGFGTIATGPFPLGSWAANPAIKPWPYDIEKAQKLFAQAGWKPGKDGLLHKLVKGKDTPFKFTMMINQGAVARERTATIVQQQLKQVGIQMEIQVVEWTTFLSQYVNKKKFDAVLLAWTLTPDPDTDLYPTWHSSQTGEHQYNFISYKNKRVDSLLMEGRRTMDLKKRAKIYHQIHSILNDEQPYTFMFVPKNLAAVHKRFKGFTIDPEAIRIHPEIGVQKWYVPAAQQKFVP